MSDDDLDSLTDTALNETLSALLPPPKHRWVESRYGPDECAHCGAAKWDDEKRCRIHWVWSPAEVLKLLDKCSEWDCSKRYPEQSENERYHVCVSSPHGEGRDATFCRAAVKALIRALRADFQRLAKDSETGAICGRCKEPVRPNVPRLGWAAGAVHAKTGRIECADQSGNEVTYTLP